MSPLNWQERCFKTADAISVNAISSKRCFPLVRRQIQKLLQGNDGLETYMRQSASSLILTLVSCGTPRKIGLAVGPVFQRNPIYDHMYNLRISLPYLWSDQKFDTYLKGHYHKDFTFLGQFCVKIITLRLINHKQNASVRLRRRYKMNFIREGNHNKFLEEFLNT